MFLKIFQSISHISRGDSVNIQWRFRCISVERRWHYITKCQSVKSEHEQLWTFFTEHSSSSSSSAMLLSHFSNDSNRTTGAILWLYISGVYPGRMQPLVDRWWEQHQGGEVQGASPLTREAVAISAPGLTAPRDKHAQSHGVLGDRVMMGEWRVKQ